MSTPPRAKSRARPDAESPPPVSLSNDLIAEILSFSDVRSLMQMRCVCKSWKSIISDSKFVKLHLKRSTRNPHLTLSRLNEVVPFPVRRLILENPLILLSDDLGYKFRNSDCRYAIGSCNGLFCLVGFTFDSNSKPVQAWFRFWNPVLGTMSKKFGHFCEDKFFKHYKFTFVYDNSLETYKVVLLKLDLVQNRTHVRVLNMREGYSVWKKFPNFPAVPLPNHYTDQAGSHGVYLNGSVNWLAIQDRPVSVNGWENIKAKEFVVVSLDMRTESYTQLMPPCHFDEMSSVKPPSLCILKDSLCFSQDFRRTEFIIWQKKIIGVEEPWTQFLKISYQNLRTRFHDFADLENCQLLPLHLSDHNDTLILANNQEQRAILYNLRDKTAKLTRIINEIRWFSAKVYVESLVFDI